MAGFDSRLIATSNGRGQSRRQWGRLGDPGAKGQRGHRKRKEAERTERRVSVSLPFRAFNARLKALQVRLDKAQLITLGT